MKSETIVVAEWQRGSREFIRVSLGRYEGQPVFDVRNHYVDCSGVLRPGRQGLTLGISHLPKLVDALVTALDKSDVVGMSVKPRS